MRKIVELGQIPGILAYLNKKAIGWCSVAPRDDFPSLDRSPNLKRIDAEPVWSITCFYVARFFRKSGLNRLPIKAAVEFAFARGARIIEAYPIVFEKAKYPKYEMYTGLFSTFKNAGFVTVCDRSKRRPIMRFRCSD
jgi:hypothetical protein